MHFISLEERIMGYGLHTKRTQPVLNSFFSGVSVVCVCCDNAGVLRVHRARFINSEQRAADEGK